MASYTFLIGLSFILLHEMDAIRLQEWQMFVVLSGLSDQLAYRVFTALHLPLYVLLFWGLFGGQSINQQLVRGLDLFFLIHVLLHIFFLKHPNNQFRSWFSWALILGAGMLGAIDLLMQQ